MELIASHALSYAVYFAPRGKVRLLNLGYLLAHRYLSPLDKLIGIIGDAGVGKSLLTKGMFPGLELTNDDEGINIRPLPLLKNIDRNYFESHTYHVDVRFEMAFTQMHILVDAIKKAIDAGKRVIVEHFDLIYDYLKINAELIIGIGEEVIVTRPSIFGPLPRDIANIVFNSIKYRKMAHSAEDITSKILHEKFGIVEEPLHTDVKHGFVLEFEKKPEVDINELESCIFDYINKGVDISYIDEKHIKIGDECYICTCPRIHIRNSSEIKNFHLLKEYRYDPISKRYAIVGIIEDGNAVDYDDLNKISL